MLAATKWHSLPKLKCLQRINFATELCSQQRTSLIDSLVKNDLNACNNFMYDCVKCGTFSCEHMDSWNRYDDECDFIIQMGLFVTIDVLGGETMIGPSIEQRPNEEWVSGFHLFLVWCLCFEIIYLWWYFIKSLLNDEMMMKCLIEFLMIVKNTMKFWSCSCWMLKQW